MSRIFIFFPFLFFLLSVANAQVTPVVSADKETILIGEPFSVLFELKAIERNANVQWTFPDSIKHFEYLAFDTADVFKRKLIITSWDSGSWQLTGVQVFVPSSVSGKPVKISFPPFTVHVVYDTTGSAILNDIKPIMEVHNEKENWIAYIILFCTVISLALLLFLFRRWNRNIVSVNSFKPASGAYDELIKALQQLKQKNWQTQSDQNERFSELTQSVKLFLERIYRQPYTKFTTDDLALELSRQHQQTDTGLLIQVLRLTDAVKFAKFTAPINDCIEAVEKTEAILSKFNQEAQR